MGELYPRHEKQTKNPAETTGNRYKIEILMSRTQKLKGLVAAFAQIENIKRQSLLNRRVASSSIIVLCISTCVVLLVVHKDKQFFVWISYSLTKY